MLSRLILMVRCDVVCFLYLIRPHIEAGLSDSQVNRRFVHIGLGRGGDEQRDAHQTHYAAEWPQTSTWVSAGGNGLTLRLVC